MAKKKYEEANIEAIANTIREKTGSDKTYKTKDMASGVGEVFEAGKQKGELDVWDIINDYGKRTDYSYAFVNWGCESVRPPYKIAPTGTIDHMFIHSSKLKIIEKKYFDFSNVSNPNSWTPSLGAICNDCRNLEVIEDVNFNGLSNYYQSFSYCRKLHTIERLVVTETITYDSAFLQCDALANITFDGAIGKNIDFKSCPLSVASLKSIVKHLKNYSGTAEGRQTLTVKASAWEALESEGLNDEDKAWLISLMPYVEDTIDLVTWAIVVDFFSWNLVLA